MHKQEVRADSRWLGSLIMRYSFWQSALVGLAHAVAALAIALELASPAWAQARDPFRPQPDPREAARDPREVGNRDFFRREFDPRRSAEDPLRANNREPLAP